MRVKKFMSILLVLLLALSLLPGAAMAAGTEITVNPPAAMPKEGETFEVTVSISGNPGLCSVQYVFTFDKSAMKCIEIEIGNVLSGFLTADNPSHDLGAMIAGANTKDSDKDGVLAIYRFNALKEIKNWDFGIADAIFCDVNEKDIAYSFVVQSTGNASENPAGSGGGQAGENPNDSESGETEKLKSGFTDMPGHWAEKYVNKAAELGLFSGYPDGTFQPDKGVTRADFVTVLWRMSGRPEPAAENPFSDVANDQYYTKAIAWAAEQGYVSGLSATKFDPFGVITREAAMMVLFKHAGGQSGAEMLFSSFYDEGFTDSGEISSWAKKAVYWGVYNELIRGTTDTTLSPKTTATRGQLAKLLTDYMDKFMN